MKRGFPDPMERLIEQFSKMPGIGARSAERLVFHILKASDGDISSFIRSVREVKDNVRSCARCNNLSDGELCAVCSDTSRDPSRICVVEGPGDVMSLERTGIYNGLYHVLLGDLSPIDDVGPDELRIKDLFGRLKREKVKEVIIATDFTTEGETTALYLMEALKRFNVRVSRLARGFPLGGSVEYADPGTLKRAFEERR